MVGMKCIIDYYNDQYEFDQSDFSKAIQLSWPIMIPLRYIFYSCSAYLTVLLTLNRYIVLCQPKFSHHMESLKKTKIFIGCVIFFSFLLNFPVFLKRSWGYDEDESIIRRILQYFYKRRSAYLWDCLWNMDMDFFSIWSCLLDVCWHLTPSCWIR